ncbi:predicted protein [Nematostella vectensis]|uniref:Uncharacterized protein n=1 Tax=Nematostella vectensis TaxID=45351 RepID=A7S7D9_NEMVE|nr:predicted protein [Nematostella vectensis]|eukprot:XP_001632472.1 predicted protein [Nematostella vectensis]
MATLSSFQGHKIAIVGDSGVGKSTIFALLTGERFSSYYVKTKERAIATKLVSLPNGTQEKLQLWDTPGADETRTYTSHSIRDVKGVILVFDVSNEDTYLNVNNWIEVINTYSNEDSVPIIVIANKIDKVRNRKVKEEQVQQLGIQKGLLFLETSAKSGLNIEQIAPLMAQELQKRSTINTLESDTLSRMNNTPPKDRSIFSSCNLL